MINRSDSHDAPSRSNRTTLRSSEKRSPRVARQTVRRRSSVGTPSTERILERRPGPSRTIRAQPDGLRGRCRARASAYPSQSSSWIRNVVSRPTVNAWFGGTHPVRQLHWVSPNQAFTVGREIDPDPRRRLDGYAERLAPDIVLEDRRAGLGWSGSGRDVVVDGGQRCPSRETLPNRALPCDTRGAALV